MTITFSILKGILDKYGQVVSHAQEGPGFTAVMPARDAEVHDEGVLYVLDASECHPEHVPPSQLLAVFKPGGEPPDGAAMAIATDLSANELQALLFKEFRAFFCWYDRLLNAVLEKEPFEVILGILHEKLLNPVWILDDSFCLISYTADDQSDEIAWRETVNTGYISYFGASSSERAAGMQQSFEDINQVILRLGAIQKPIICSKIVLNGRVKAILNVIAKNHPFADGEAEICKCAADLLRFSIQDRLMEKVTESTREGKLLTDILEGNLSSEIAINERMKTLGIHLKGPYQVMAIPVRPLNPTVEDLNKLALQLYMVFPRGITVAYKDMLVTLLDRAVREPVGDETFGSLDEFLRSYCLLAGVSEQYHNLAESRSAFVHAMQVTTGAKSFDPYGRIFSYHDFAFLHVTNILSDAGNITDFCHKGVLALLKHDKEEKTELTHTLRVYLKYNLSPNAAAQELFIHRSTLRYRLCRIEEITGLSLSNSEQLFYINFSLHLLEYNQTFSSMIN